MIPIVEELVKYSSLPIIVNPNAGLPEIQNGKTVYNISPKEFAGYMIEIVNSGACLIGGCCGTTPEYLKEMILATKDLPYLYPEKKSDSIFNEPADSGTPDEGNENSVATDSELMTAIFEGEDDDAVRTAEELVKTISPIDIINTHIIPAPNRVGDAFASGDIFLPELMMSAETASAAFNTVKKYMSQSSDNSDKNKKSIIIATVKGDVHDIGKDIVKVLLESYGFEVYDLGIDVAPEKIADCAFDTGCKLVGLSALMTTTVPAMAQTIQLLHEKDDSIKVIVGGAVLTKELADEIGADFYSPDAMATVHHAEKFYA